MQTLTRTIWLAFATWTVLLLSACQTTPKSESLDNGLTAEQVAGLEEIGFQHINRGMKYDMSGKILFATDSVELSTDSLQVISNISEALQSLGIAQMRLEGHTDNQGSAAYNQRLSEQRALAVADVLLLRYLPEATITTIGIGPSMPIADNNTEEGRSENRRVTMIVGAASQPAQ